MLCELSPPLKEKEREEGRKLGRREGWKEGGECRGWGGGGVRGWGRGGKRKKGRKGRVWEPAASASPGNLLAMHIFKLCPHPTPPHLLTQKLQGGDSAVLSHKLPRLILKVWIHWF